MALPRGAHLVLVARRLVDPLIERTTGLVLRRGFAPAPAAQELLDLLAERLAKTEAYRAGRRRCGALQAMQIIDGALRVAGGGEDKALVVLQHREP